MGRAKPAVDEPIATESAEVSSGRLYFLRHPILQHSRFRRVAAALALRNFKSTQAARGLGRRSFSGIKCSGGNIVLPYTAFDELAIFLRECGVVLKANGARAVFGFD